MRTWQMLTAALTLTVALGCDTGTTSDTKDTAKLSGRDDAKRGVGQDDRPAGAKGAGQGERVQGSFTLKDIEPVELQAGQTESVTVGIDRQEGFDGAVQLSFDKAMGIEIKTENPVIEQGSNETEVEIHAPDVKLNQVEEPAETKINVTAKAQGADQSATKGFVVRIVPGDKE